MSKYISRNTHVSVELFRSHESIFKVEITLDMPELLPANNKVDIVIVNLVCLQYIDHDK